MRLLIESETVREWPARTDQVGGSLGLMTNERAVLSRWMELSSMEHADWRMGSWAAEPYRQTEYTWFLQHMPQLFFKTHIEYLSKHISNAVPPGWFEQGCWQTPGWKQTWSGSPRPRWAEPWRLDTCSCSRLRNHHLRPKERERGNLKVHESLESCIMQQLTDRS